MSSSTRPTLSQVAERAEVSVASASRALTGASASPRMVARVRAAADELGYVADSRARSLKMGRTEQLAFAAADLGNPVYVSMMRAIAAEVRQAGYRLLISSTGAEPADEIGVIHGFNHGYADGVIISPLRITEEVLNAITQATVPIVVVGSIPPSVGIDNVRANSGRGVDLAVRHLVDSGRRSIGFINGPIDTVPGQARGRGFARVMKALHLPVGEHQVVIAADFTHQDGETATATLLRAFAPDALVCANDLIAVGALRALRERGLRTPKDVAVVGMDNTDLAELTTPTLTSVYLGSAERGRLAARMLLERLANPDRPPARVIVQPKLIVRESTRGR
jgi:LacI family transcriptional regulator, galactose operon repressor